MRGFAPSMIHQSSRRWVLPVTAFLWASSLGLAAPLSGTKSVGPTGDYTSLTAAIVDIQAQTVGGAIVLELQPAYVSSVETFPLVFGNLGTTDSNTLTVRPQLGATALSITSSDTTAATVDLNGAQFVTLDGRPGGTGTTKLLTIANTSISGVAVRFINEASGNKLKFLTVQGVNTSATSGTVVFSTTTGANGNDDNTIDTCDIRDGASTPTNAIYSLGSTGTAAQLNRGDTVTNCNIFNFYSNSGNSAGVRLDSGSTDWILTGNSFYQTSSRVAVAAETWAIFIDSGSNFLVSNNSIGGSVPGGGGTAWTTVGTSAAMRFTGIELRVGGAIPSSVQGNMIKNFVWTSSSNLTSSTGVWCGIFIFSGSANVGTVTGNTIGSGAGTGSIAVTTSGSGGTTFGIGSSSSGTVAIASNTIGSITSSSSSSIISASITGIQVTAGANTIFNNLVGSTTTANSLNASTSSTSATGQQVTGILSSSSTSASITGNTVANLNNNYAGSAIDGQIRGIAISGGVDIITGNTVRNLSTTSLNVGLITSASVLGISQFSPAAGQTVSQNVVYSLANAALTPANVSVTGIYYAGSATTGPNLVARNLVHSLAISSLGTSTQLCGMYFNGGTFNAQNNMVRVGLNASGAGTANAGQTLGIADNIATAGRNFYHNSVYIGGTQTSGASATYAFLSVGASNARDFRNNIFVNARSNSGATSKHYAVQYGGTTANPAGLIANNNLLLASGTGGVLGRYNITDFATLAGWQAATGQDISSAVADPLFVNPTGNVSAVNLHLQPGTPADGTGVLIAAVTDDYDGQMRSSLTPVDIGADAGGYTILDTLEPSISYPLLTSGTTANRTLTGWASIADNSGVIASGANAPRFYFKKSTDADVFGVTNDSSGNGWKYVVGTDAGGGSYSFTIDYTLINGGSVSKGDIVQYFVVAQDAANNLASSPAAASALANPPLQNISAKPGAGVNSYSIVGTISGTVTVGPTGTYSSLSGAGGLFAALNASVLTGNITVNLAGDTAEDGSTVLNAMRQDNYPNTFPFTITLQPDGATMRTVSGSGASGLIRLNGANRVTIDGSFGGSGRYLTFRNTSPTGATIQLINDASNNTVRNCVIEGASGISGVVFFSTGVATGNDNNTVTGNQIRDRSDAAGVPNALIASIGTSNAVANSNNTIANNELFNFSSYGTYVAAGSDSWSISGNTIYQTAARTTALCGIALNAPGTNTIRNNTVHDLTTNHAADGIVVGGSAGSIMVAGNRIWNLGNTASSTAATCGILFQPGAGQSVTVVSNMVSLSSSGTAAQIIYGIHGAGYSGSTTITSYNTVLITGAGGAGADTWALLRTVDSNATVKDNVFLNLRTGGGNHFAANCLSTGPGPLTMDSNVYAGTGLTTATDFFDASDGFNSTGSPISYEQWQTNVPSDTHSSASTPGGNYSSAMFVDAATGDLHLVPGGNVLVNGRGTPIDGITTDLDGDARSAIAPIIGADEILLSNNDDLSALALSAGVLNTAFNASTLTYNLTVSNSTASTTLTATRADANAKLQLQHNGGGFNLLTSGAATSAQALNVGTNILDVRVTAQDTVTVKTYVVTVSRNSVFQDWAGTNGVESDPAATSTNGLTNLLNFSFGVNPVSGDRGPLIFTGTFGAGGTIGATGQPITRIEGSDARALFVRRKDFAAAGLTYTVEFTPDLSAWQTSTDNPIVLADDGVNQIVSVAYPTGITSHGCFRVKVTLP